jgi:hypothetical protein
MRSLDAHAWSCREVDLSRAIADVACDAKSGAVEPDSHKKVQKNTLAIGVETRWWY